VSDEHHDHHERGGHEIDKLPSVRLFNLLFGLSFLTLLASIGVVQLFNLQVEDIQDSRASVGSYRLDEYTQQVQQLLSGYGQVTVTEDGGAETPRYHIPVDEARKKLLENPELLGATAKYRGWEGSGPGKAVSEVETAAQKAMPPVPPPGAVPTDAQGEPQQPEGGAGGGEPAKQEPAEPADEPADDEPADDDEPAAGAPNKPAEEPAGDAPAKPDEPKPKKPAGDAPAKPDQPKPKPKKPAGDAPAKPDKPKPKKPAGDQP
jgi:hypothetical protein